MQTLRVAHVLVSPGDDAASTVREPSSAPSDTRQEPPIHEGPLHCPAPVSSVPATSESTNTLSRNSTLAFGSAQSPKNSVHRANKQNFMFKRNTQKNYTVRLHKANWAETEVLFRSKTQIFPKLLKVHFVPAKLSLT